MGKDERKMTIREYSTDPDNANASEVSAPTDIEGSEEHTDWQRVWLRTQSRDWRTLALVPGDEQTCTLDVANLIAALARDHGEQVVVADLRDLRLKYVDTCLQGMRGDASQSERIIFATRSTSRNLATIRLARAADCAILCASLGSTSLDSVKETIEQIGREHFLGSLLVRTSTTSDVPGLALSPWRSSPKAQP
jgi:hypothetical protein